MRNQGVGRNTITATPRQLESMVRLSEALARMRLSSTVERHDVAEAVRLMKVGDILRLNASVCHAGPQYQDLGMEPAHPRCRLQQGVQLHSRSSYYSVLLNANSSTCLASRDWTL